MRPRQVDDAEILAATRMCILRDGPGVSTAVVAQAVGLSQPALFKRFGTKDELWRQALLPTGPIAWIDAAERGPDGRPGRDQVEDILRMLASFLDEFLPCFIALKTSGIDLHRVFEGHSEPPPVRGHRALTSWFTAARSRGLVRSDVDPTTVATLVMGTMQARVMLRHVFGIPTPTHGYVDEVLRLVWPGLAPEAP